jgi:ferredoxin
MVEVEDGVFVPWLDDVAACSGCGRCEAACTWAAIALTAYVELAEERLRTRRPVPVALAPDASAA